MRNNGQARIAHARLGEASNAVAAFTCGESYGEQGKFAVRSPMVEGLTPYRPQAMAFNGKAYCPDSADFRLTWLG